MHSVGYMKSIYRSLIILLVLGFQGAHTHAQDTVTDVGRWNGTGGVMLFKVHHNSFAQIFAQDCLFGEDPTRGKSVSLIASREQLQLLRNLVDEALAQMSDQ